MRTEIAFKEAASDDELLEELRKRILSRGPELSEFDVKDIDRAQHDDAYITRFLDHKKGDVDKALEMMLECFKWRKTFTINSLLERNIDRRLFEVGFLYPHNVDKNNNTLLIFHMKLYKKDACDLNEVKKLFAFALEKMSQGNASKKVVMLFDMQDAQMANMDLELVKFIIKCFQSYFPNMLEYMIVFEKPWILTAAWKYVKTLVSTDPNFKIKFVNKTEILQYIDADQLLVQMGGTDAYAYKYPPQLFSTNSACNGLSQKQQCLKKNDMFSSISTSVDVSNLKSLEATYNKNQEISSSSVEHSLTDGSTQKAVVKSDSRSSLLRRIKKRDQHVKRKNRLENTGPLVTISPANELLFCGPANSSSGELLQVITITNTVSSLIAFKIKTTSPENFRVRPSSGPIQPGNTVEVLVNLQPGHNAEVAKDRFLILSTIVPADQDKSDLASMWKIIPKSSVMEQRLRCRFDTSNSASVDSDGESSKSPDMEMSSQELLVKLTKVSQNVEHKIDKMQHKVSQLERDVKILFRLLIFLLFLLILIFIFVFFYLSKYLLPRTFT